MTATVYVRHQGLRRLLRRHPWVFRSSVERIEGAPADGDVVDVRAPDGRFLARGFFSSRSLLQVRAFAFEEGVEADAALVHARLAAAVAFRREVCRLPSAETDCWRAVHGDADLLPGVVLDLLGEVAVLQITSVGFERRRALLLDAIEEQLRPRAIVERSDDRTRAREGLPPVVGLVRGSLPAADAEGRWWVRERGLVFPCDPLGGQKTGFYADQRDNRALVAELAPGRTVLDLFCYSGGFALAAARAGARRVTAVERSAEALELARAAAVRNRLEVELVRADAFRFLQQCRAEGRTFELIVLDPPRYAVSRRSLEPALEKYGALARLALGVTAPGAVLLACSCSGLLEEARFEELLAEAARRAGRHLRVFHRGGQAADHPVAASCPEGRYLKALFCHVA
ncbi:MAG: ribosomal RNA large subunit methyltransferase I [Planctomycetota bacterium]|nr:MAG: ribosomal RNA large subunit methyltransferase I [Planctomycetota bacterium]